MSSIQDPPVFVVKISDLAFLALLFFAFFGTSLPFQPPVSEIDEKATSNIVNQVVFSTLFLASLPGLWYFRKYVLLLLKNEKFLVLFILWCAISISWSEYPFVSFKRLFRTLVTILVSLTALMSHRSSQDLRPSFRPILLVYVVLSLVAVSAVAGAIDPKTLTWRGFAPSKNHLGQAALVCILFWALEATRGGFKGRAVAVLMGMVSLVLLLGSRSITSLVTLFMVAALAALLFANARFRHLGIGNSFFAISAALFLALSFGVVLFSPEVMRDFLPVLGKDVTFTGRTELWSTIWEQARTHLLLGSGFEGFWVVQSPKLTRVYETFVWLPNQAHMGYLDILNETGVVGLSLVVAAVVKYLLKLIRSPRPHPWKWFVIAALIINFQESTLFRQNLLTGVMFLFAYLAFYRDSLVKEQVARGTNRKAFS